MIVSVRPDANGNICIFYEGDENVTQAIFENPDSDFKWSLRYLRRGDKRPYNVPLEERDEGLVWTVTLADTEKPGTGYAQLVGSAEGQTKHGRPFTVTVYKSLEKPGDVPSAEKAFGDAVAADAAKAVKAAEDAAKVYANVQRDLEEGKLKGVKDANGIWTQFTVKSWSGVDVGNAAYFRLNCAEINNDSIITVNEEIT